MRTGGGRGRPRRIETPAVDVGQELVAVEGVPALAGEPLQAGAARGRSCGGRFGGWYGQGNGTHVNTPCKSRTHPRKGAEGRDCNKRATLYLLTNTRIFKNLSGEPGLYLAKNSRQIYPGYPYGASFFPACCGPFPALLGPGDAGGAGAVFPGWGFRGSWTRTRAGMPRSPGSFSSSGIGSSPTSTCCPTWRSRPWSTGSRR